MSEFPTPLEFSTTSEFPNLPTSMAFLQDKFQCPPMVGV
eukprot:CAMPEP_0180140592 /NCGR_PEP_ID=MMETSP0986-20121125/14338_1 /TAXON_ID=697907 /ORGANISM="non described non described, Strain CCMP2293" /LENGTH=38 /DNA_ID= /DNA_START= /DNA_END= /DNA_ORIENTATION=